MLAGASQASPPRLGLFVHVTVVVQIQGTFIRIRRTRKAGSGMAENLSDINEPVLMSGALVFQATWQISTSSNFSGGGGGARGHFIRFRCFTGLWLKLRFFVRAWPVRVAEVGDLEPLLWTRQCPQREGCCGASSE